MTISIWRYSHLVLAVSSCIFIALASVSGVILSFEPIDNTMPSYKVARLDTITVAQSLGALSKKFPEITAINVDERNFVTLKGFDENGDEINVYIDPATGEVLGTPQKQSDFYKWVTAFHRSLFLHEAGRFFIGLTAFLLMLITVSGLVLVIQRQHGITRFFGRVVKEYFAQYYHVVLGRLLLIPVFIIAASGVWLSLVRFEIFPEKKITHKVVFDEEEEQPQQKDITTFTVFKNIRFSQLTTIEFPFAGDPEEYYLLKLKDREIAVNQFDGAVLSEVKYPFSALLTNLSLDLHTGRTNMVWAVILGIASINILFFIYSGFSITLRRRKGRIRNKYTAAEAKYILLAGSENGSTLQFAGAVHKQLLANKQFSFLSEPNKYTVFPKAEYLVIFTSTYGLGDAPDNATRLMHLIEKYKQHHQVKVAVVGFGSHAYPDFCAYAKQVDAMLAKQSWADKMLDIYTVNDKSPDEFAAWVKAWSHAAGVVLDTTAAVYSQYQTGLQKMMILEKTSLPENDSTFMLTINPGFRSRFHSGDLLAVYPNGDARVRFYSIAKVNHNIQLVVKYLPGGLGSEFLYSLKEGSVIRARIVHNGSFHFPKKAPVVVMIANGTGIAPFLGMIAQNNKKRDCHLYCGFRRQTEATRQYQQTLQQHIEKQKLHNFHMAFSREEDHCYVMDLIQRDANFFADMLMSGGVIMICGSLAMQQDVEATLDAICIEKTQNDLAYYKLKGQVLADCY